MACLGYASALQGRLADRRALLEEAISERLPLGARPRPIWVAWLSEVCRLAERGEEAWQHARQALDLARQQKERSDEAFALHQLGTVRTHTDPPDAVQSAAATRLRSLIAIPGRVLWEGDMSFAPPSWIRLLGG